MIPANNLEDFHKKILAGGEENRFLTAYFSYFPTFSTNSDWKLLPIDGDVTWWGGSGRRVYAHRYAGFSTEKGGIVKTGNIC